MDIEAYEAHYAAERRAMSVELANRGRAEMRASAERTLTGVASDCNHCGRTSYWCDCATRCPWNI